jgi:hypothetical protein
MSFILLADFSNEEWELVPHTRAEESQTRKSLKIREDGIRKLHSLGISRGGRDHCTYPKEAKRVTFTLLNELNKEFLAIENITNEEK